MTEFPLQKQIHRMKAVQAKTGLGRSSIYNQVRAGKLAKPVPLTGRTVGWVDSDIEAWIDARSAERDARAA